MAVLAGSCTEKKKSDTIIVPKPGPVVMKPIQKMSQYEQTRAVEWMGAEYQVAVKRVSDPRLPVLRIDAATRYYDNTITVKILRKDGSVFFSRSFTKDDFVDCLDDQTKEKGALLGIVFVSDEGDFLDFAASVGSPDANSDEYVPLVLKISKMGNVVINSDETLDTDTGSDSDADKNAVQNNSGSSNSKGDDDGV